MNGEQPRERLDSTPSGSPLFTTTHWSVVLAAGHDSAPGAEAALQSLCRAYWYPLYCFVRRQGYRPADAEDLTQALFAHLLERNAFRRVTREKGRFRSFLLAALKYFLADEWDKARAQKRGAGYAVVSLDEEGAEERYQRDFSQELSAEKLYERRWAMAVLERAFVRLRDEITVAGKASMYEELRRLQDDSSDAEPYAEVAMRLGLPVNTLKSHVRRFRERYRELLRDEIAQTVATPTEIAEELRHLLAVVSG